MDFLKKHYFWIVCGVLVVAALGAWVWTSMDMGTRFAADQAKIDTALADLTAVQNIQNHPNDITAQHMDERIRALKASVKQAWLDQYTQQAQIFVWPDQIFDNPTRRTLSRYRPIELHFPVFPTPDADEVNPTWRFAYSNYMRDELPKLAEIIGAKWQVNTDAAATGGSESYGGSSGYNPYSTPDFSAGASYPGAEGGVAGAVEVERPVVEWSAANQQEIYNLRFNWSTMPNAAPTTLQMLYAQEDFWTLQSLMEIIRRTNGDADAYYEALVKEIQFIRIGAAAVRSDAVIMPLMAPGALASGTMGPEGMPSEGSGDPYAIEGMPSPGTEGGMPMPGQPGMEGSGSGMLSPMAIDPATGRYVDNAYKPLTAEELRASLTATDPTKAYLAVAKRMPVRMRIKMDQRYLSRLLIECANAPLTLEVRQVRINPSTSGAASAYGGSGGSPYSMPSMPSGSSGFGGAFSSGAMESSSGESGYGSGSGTGVGPGSSFDAVVEIYGIVYIYNPPAEKALESEAEEGSEATPAPAGETLTSAG